MNLRKIFERQIKEQRTSSFWLFFYEDKGRNQFSVEKINVWEVGSLMETHTLSSKQDNGLPIFAKKSEIKLPK